MHTIIIVTLSLGILIMLILMEYVIIQKKKIYRTFIDPNSKKAAAGFSNYDSYWFGEDIGLDNLMEKNPDDEWLQKTGKAIKNCQVIFLCILAFMIVAGIVGKVFG